MSTRPTERVTLHFDLSHLARLPHDEEFHRSVGMGED